MYRVRWQHALYLWRQQYVCFWQCHLLLQWIAMMMDNTPLHVLCLWSFGHYELWALWMGLFIASLGRFYEWHVLVILYLALSTYFILWQWNKVNFNQFEIKFSFTKIIAIQYVIVIVIYMYSSYPLIGLMDCLSLCCFVWSPGDNEATNSLWSQHTPER